MPHEKGDAKTNDDSGSGYDEDISKVKRNGQPWELKPCFQIDSFRKPETVTTLFQSILGFVF